jgi:hypothetical protein
MESKEPIESKSSLQELADFSSTSSVIPTSKDDITCCMNWRRYPTFENRQHAEMKCGDQVYARKSSLRATIIKTVEQVRKDDKEGKFKGRVQIEYEEDQLTYHVNPNKLQCRYVNERPITFLTNLTSEYRDAARCLPGRDDRVLEIGSSFGEATCILEAQAGRGVVGIEVSKECIENARKRCPQVEFHCLNALLDMRYIIKIGQGCNVIFVDIGGDRSVDDLAELIPALENTFRPSLMVIKSKALSKATRDMFTQLGEVKPEHIGFWQKIVSDRWREAGVNLGVI